MFHILGKEGSKCVPQGPRRVIIVLSCIKFIFYLIKGNEEIQKLEQKGKREIAIKKRKL